jgi:hypothetical protein
MSANLGTDRREIDEIVNDAIRKALVELFSTRLSVEHEKSNPKGGNGHSSSGNLAEGAIGDRAAPDSLHSTKPADFINAFDWYSQLFGAVTAISTLGAGFTFTILFSEIQVPRGVSVDRADAVVQYIRTCLSAAWMLFVFSVGLSTFAILVNSSKKGDLVKLVEVRITKAGKSDHSIWVNIYRMAVDCFTLLTELTPVGAFLASAEALRQYESAVGMFTLIGTSVTGLILIMIWASQTVRQSLVVQSTVMLRRDRLAVSGGCSSNLSKVCKLTLSSFKAAAGGLDPGLHMGIPVGTSVPKCSHRPDANFRVDQWCDDCQEE